MVTAPAQAQTYDGSTPLDNDRHELFCHQYLIHFNAKAAVIEAGFSKNGAKQAGHRLLTDVDRDDIRARLTYLKDQRIQRARMTGDDVLYELECMAKSRIGRVVVFNESGATFVHSPDTLPDEDHAAIQSVEVKEDHYGNPEKGAGVILTTKVKMYDKLGALKELAKHHGVCKADMSLTLNGESLPEGITINFVSVKKESE